MEYYRPGVRLLVNFYVTWAGDYFIEGGPRYETLRYYDREIGAACGNRINFINQIRLVKGFLSRMASNNEYSLRDYARLLYNSKALLFMRKTVKTPARIHNIIEGEPGALYDDLGFVVGRVEDPVAEPVRVEGDWAAWIPSIMSVEKARRYVLSL